MSDIVMRHGSWLDMNPKGLVGWSNGGTVKRARMELMREHITWDIDEQNHATIVSWSDDTETTLPVDASTSNVFVDASCNCPSTGRCRHIIRAMLLLMRLHHKAAENLQQDVLCFEGYCANEPIEELEAIVTRGEVPKVVFFSPPQTVSFWSKRTYQLSTCDCGAQDLCEHKELARQLITANDRAHEIYTSPTSSDESGRINGSPERLMGMGFRTLEPTNTGARKHITAALMTRLSQRPCFIEQPIEEGESASEAVHRLTIRGRDLASLSHGQIVARSLERSRRGILNMDTREPVSSYPQSYDWDDLVTSGLGGSFKAIAYQTTQYTSAFPPDLHLELSFHVGAIERILIEPDGSLIFEDRAGTLAYHRHPSPDERQTLPFLSGLIEEGHKPLFVAGVFDARKEDLFILPFSIVLENSDGEREMFIPSLPTTEP